MIAADHQRFMDAVAVSKARVVSFIASIPHDLAAREDRVAEEVLTENSSAKSKLGKLYRLVEELGGGGKTSYCMRKRLFCLLPDECDYLFHGSRASGAIQ